MKSWSTPQDKIPFKSKKDININNLFSIGIPYLISEISFLYCNILLLKAMGVCELDLLP